jgi:hypothetical protein
MPRIDPSALIRLVESLSNVKSQGKNVGISRPSKDNPYVTQGEGLVQQSPETVLPPNWNQMTDEEKAIFAARSAGGHMEFMQGSQSPNLQPRGEWMGDSPAIIHADPQQTLRQGAPDPAGGAEAPSSYSPNVMLTPEMPSDPRQRFIELIKSDPKFEGMSPSQVAQTVDESNAANSFEQLSNLMRSRHLEKPIGKPIEPDYGERVPVEELDQLQNPVKEQLSGSQDYIRKNFPALLRARSAYGPGLQMRSPRASTGQEIQALNLLDPDRLKTDMPELYNYMMHLNATKPGQVASNPMATRLGAAISGKPGYAKSPAQVKQEERLAAQQDLEVKRNIVPEQTNVDNVFSDASMAKTASESWDDVFADVSSRTRRLDDPTQKELIKGGEAQKRSEVKKGQEDLDIDRAPNQAVVKEVQDIVNQVTNDPDEQMSIVQQIMFTMEEMQPSEGITAYLSKNKEAIVDRLRKGVKEKQALPDKTIDTGPEPLNIDEFSSSPSEKLRRHMVEPTVRGYGESRQKPQGTYESRPGPITDWGTASTVDEIERLMEALKQRQK